jgi:hypothetical protein
VKRFDSSGKVCGEHRFLGLYTSTAYSASPADIPLLRRKTANVIDRAGVARGSHAGKALRNILATYPRDELFQTAEDELLRTATGILHLGERQRFGCSCGAIHSSGFSSASSTRRARTTPPSCARSGRRSCTRHSTGRARTSTCIFRSRCWPA